MGYLVFRTRREVIEVVDLVSLPDPEIRAALAGELVSLGHARGASALETSVLAGSPAAQAFASLGFVPRDDDPGVVVHAPRAAPPMIAALHDVNRWWTLEGDKDV